MSIDLQSVQDAVIAFATIAGVAVLFALAFFTVSAVMSRRTRKPAVVTAQFAHPVATDRTADFAHPVAADRTRELISR
jgi:hypothetical protein